MTEFWPQWQDEIINGAYCLRRLLHASDHGALFLADSKGTDLPSIAIKIIAAERVTLAQLSYWRAAAALSHPHLIRLIDAGLCQFAGRQFLFVVMEYADQTLSQVLLHRALTCDEVQELIAPVVQALAFLHRENLVQGELKPGSVLVVNDQLKLATDTVRPSGAARASTDAEGSLYDPPEAAGGRLTPAGDIWALGMSIVEALTQRRPASPDERSLAAALPTTLAPTLVDTLQRCLSHDPARRPTAFDLQALFGPAPQAPGITVPAVVVSEAPRPAPPLQEPAKQRALVPLVATILVLSAAVWAGLRLFQTHPSTPLASTAQGGSRPGTPPAAVVQTHPAPVPAPVNIAAPSGSAKSRGSNPLPPHPVSRPPEQPAQPPADASSAVVLEELPQVPRSASATIQGHVKVTVLVIIGPSGDVVDAILEKPGPSAYFARLAREAAKKWKFRPAENQDSREELLKFEFTRSGTTARAVDPPS
jgi:TonB family protein